MRNENDYVKPVYWKYADSDRNKGPGRFGWEEVVKSNLLSDKYLIIVFSSFPVFARMASTYHVLICIKIFLHTLLLKLIKKTEKIS